MTDRACQIAQATVWLVLAFLMTLPEAWAGPGGPGPRDGGVPRVVTDYGSDLIVPGGGPRRARRRAMCKDVPPPPEKTMTP